MYYRQAGAATSVSFDILVGGSLVSPDLNSVSYTIKNTAGTIVGSGTITLPANSTSVSVPVSAIQNTKTLAVEYREVEVTFQFDSNTYRRALTYRLVPWLMIPVTRDRVRSYLSLTTGELKDDEIDLISAYLKAEEDIGTSLVSIFTTGDAKAAYATEAIFYAAVLQLLDTLSLRAMAKEQADNYVGARQDKIDFTGIKETVEDKYWVNVDAAAGNVVLEGDLALSAVGRPTPDPVTGS